MGLPLGASFTRLVNANVIDAATAANLTNLEIKFINELTEDEVDALLSLKDKLGGPPIAFQPGVPIMQVGIV